VPDQQWMSKHDRFANNSTDLYLINAFCSTISSGTTSVSQLAAVFFTLPGFFAQRHERPVLLHTVDFLGAKSAKELLDKLPSVKFAFRVSLKYFIRQPRIIFPAHCRETFMPHLPTYQL